MTDQTVISHLTVLLENGDQLPGHHIAVAGGRITGLEPGPPPPGTNVIDGRGLLAVPGFIDLHIQGAGGGCVMDGKPGSIDTICRTFAQHGTTGFLLTPIPAAEDDYRNLRVIRERIQAGPPGTRILGIHLEGPFLNLEYKGGFTGKQFQAPSLNLLGKYLEVCGPENVKMMTIAPELPGAPEVIEELVRNHIIASVGHTDGTFDQVRAAFDRGASHVTHMFNAMRGFHHREPGAVGAALRDPRPSLQVIADGYHLHPETISLLVQNKPLPRINLITDAMRCADMPDGCTYQSFGHTVTVQKGRVSLEDGTLAGSTLTMEKAVKNMRAFTGLPLGEAIRMASLYPAETIGLAGCKGSLAVGKDADIVLLDSNLEEIGRAHV